jgi:hypothetical protein
MRFLARGGGFAFLVLAALAPAMRADTLVRYHTDIQTAPPIPAGVLDQAISGLRDTVIRIKGTKAYSSQGHLITITDWMTQELILVDAAHKRFATAPAAQYAEQLRSAIPAMPDQARAALASLKTNFESHSTGQTTTIQGIEAEEREFVVTMDMALPGGPQTSSPFMKMIMHVRTAKPEELERVAALQEFKNYMTSASSAMNPAQMLKQVLSIMPGIGDNLSTMNAEMNGALSLRMHAEVFMPILAMLSQQVPGQALPADPNAPLMQMNQELVELSSGPLDDSLFQVPADYQAAPLEEILKGAISAAAPPQFK